VRVPCGYVSFAAMATHVTEAERLAQEIAIKTQEYIAVLRKNAAALPSHDAAEATNDTLPLQGAALQNNLMELTTELQALIQGPRLYVQNQILAVRRPWKDTYLPSRNR
jgi:hypothetical protein